MDNSAWHCTGGPRLRPDHARLRCRLRLQCRRLSGGDCGASSGACGQSDYGISNYFDKTVAAAPGSVASTTCSWTAPIRRNTRLATAFDTSAATYPYYPAANRRSWKRTTPTMASAPAAKFASAAPSASAALATPATPVAVATADAIAAAACNACENQGLRLGSRLLGSRQRRDHRFLHRRQSPGRPGAWSSA